MRPLSARKSSPLSPKGKARDNAGAAEQAKPARRGKQEIASKAKIKDINDTLQSVMKQAKPARRGKKGCNVFNDCIERLRKTS